jgi:hypothetical protein
MILQEINKINLDYRFDRNSSKVNQNLKRLSKIEESNIILIIESQSLAKQTSENIEVDVG